VYILYLQLMIIYIFSVLCSYSVQFKLTCAVTILLRSEIVILTVFFFIFFFPTRRYRIPSLPCLRCRKGSNVILFKLVYVFVYVHGES
jgi:hypothetical protein